MRRSTLDIKIYVKRKVVVCSTGALATDRAGEIVSPSVLCFTGTLAADRDGVLFNLVLYVLQVPWPLIVS